MASIELGWRVGPYSANVVRFFFSPTASTQRNLKKKNRGGGSTLVYLLRTKEKLTAMIDDEDEKLAVDILYRAMTYPIIQIAENAGSEGALVLEKVKDQKFGFGWNAATDSYEDLLETGVIDPSTVTMQAILNSCSIAASVPALR